MFPRPSGWTVGTSGTSGLNVDIFDAAGDWIDLRDPSTKSQNFRFRVTLPKVGTPSAFP